MKQAPSPYAEPANSIIAALGDGEQAIAEALGVAQSTVNRWRRPLVAKSFGTNGRIPWKYYDPLIALAAQKRMLLVRSDFVREPNDPVTAAELRIRFDRAQRRASCA